MQRISESNNLMSKEGNKILSALISKTSLTVIFFILGVGAYVWGFLIEDKSSVWREILLTAGNVLVIGVVIGFIANAEQFLRIFKEELQKVVYGKEFVGKLKDVTDMWETISKHLFKYKFPGIHGDFLKTVKRYFPQDEVSYYNDYDVNIKIEWHNSCTNIIKVIESVRFELVAESESKFNYPLKNWTRVSDGKEYENRITKFTIDDEPSKMPKAIEKIEDGCRCEERLIELKGKKTYTIDYTRESIYDLKDDHYIGFRAKYIVKDLRVSFECPEDIDAQFICRGTQNDFSTIGNSTSHNIQKKYKGIILPRQGYIFSLHKIETTK